VNGFFRCVIHSHPQTRLMRWPRFMQDFRAGPEAQGIRDKGADAGETWVVRLHRAGGRAWRDLSDEERSVSCIFLVLLLGMCPVLRPGWWLGGHLFIYVCVCVDADADADCCRRIKRRQRWQGRRRRRGVDCHRLTVWWDWPGVNWNYWYDCGGSTLIAHACTHQVPAKDYLF
jgi:hypothetical protein